MRLLKSHPILGLLNSYMVDSPQPASISYMWNFGSLLGACLIIQIATGIVLAMHYTPNIDLAFVSVEHIMRDVHYGWMIRYLHANTASFFFIFVYLHIARGLYYGSYRSPRILPWSIGVIILVLMIVTAFLGYVLPYGQMSLWGATVITNLMSAIPWIGQNVVEFLWGGFSVSNATLNRFFSLHYLLPFILAALAVMHMLAIHEHGSGNPLGVSGNTDRLPMHPYFIFKDLVTIFLFLLVLALVIFYAPNMMGHSDNYIPANPMQTPPSIVPEWYLLPFYAILRSIPNKLLGVVAMLLSLLILLIMPLVDTSRVRGSQFRPLMRWAFWFFVGNFFVLFFIGSQHVEEPYITIGAVSTAFYFSWFLIVIPFIGIVENTLLDIATESKSSTNVNTSPTPLFIKYLLIGILFFVVLLLLYALLSSPLFCAEEGDKKPVEITIPWSQNLLAASGIVGGSYLVTASALKAFPAMPVSGKLVTAAGAFVTSAGFGAFAVPTVKAVLDNSIESASVESSHLKLTFTPPFYNMPTTMVPIPKMEPKSNLLQQIDIFNWNIDLGFLDLLDLSFFTQLNSSLWVSGLIGLAAVGANVNPTNSVTITPPVPSNTNNLQLLMEFHNQLHFGLLLMLIGWLITAFVVILTYYSVHFESSLETRLQNHPLILKYLKSMIAVRQFTFYWVSLMVVPELVVAIVGVYMLWCNPVIV